MARTHVTKRITRKGSKQLTDKERASQVASLTIPPVIPPKNKGDDDEGEESDGQPLWFGKEVMDSARAAQKRRKTLTPEQLAIEMDATRKSMGMIPMADLKEMQAAHKIQEERDKQRADAKGSVADPLEVDNDDDEEENDNENDKGEDDSSPTTNSSLTKAPTTQTKVRIETPMTMTPVVTTTPTRTTLSQPTTNRQRRKRAAEEDLPQVPYRFPVILTGQPQGQLKREKLPMFWSQSAQNTQLPSSWRTMDWIVSMKSRS